MNNGLNRYTNARDVDTETLQFLLKKEQYRYQLALRDGAVASITEEVIKTIRELEEEMERRFNVREKGNGRP